MNTIKMGSNHKYLKHWLEKDILIFKLVNSKMLENIGRICLIESRKKRKKLKPVILGKSSNSNWRKDYNALYAKRLIIHLRLKCNYIFKLPLVQKLKKVHK